MATHSSGLAWRIPGLGDPGGLPSMGLHGVGYGWSDIAALHKSSEWSSLVSGPRLNFSPLGAKNNGVFAWFNNNLSKCPRATSWWSTTTESECLEPVVCIKRSIGLKSQCAEITEQPLLAANREVLSSNEDLVQPKLKKKKVLPEKPVRAQGKQGIKKDETSLALISCKSWRGKLQPVFAGNLGYKLCLKCAPNQG